MKKKIEKLTKELYCHMHTVIECCIKNADRLLCRESKAWPSYSVHNITRIGRLVENDYYQADCLM